MVGRSFHILKLVVSSTQYVGWACLIAMAVLMSAGTIARYVFNAPLPFVDEVVENLMIPLAFFGVAYVFLINGHIRVDVVTRRLPQKWQSYLLAFNQVLAIFFLHVLTVASWPQIGIALRVDRRLETLPMVPDVYFRVIMFIGCGLAEIFLIAMFIEHVYRIAKKGRGVVA